MKDEFEELGFSVGNITTYTNETIKLTTFFIDLNPVFQSKQTSENYHRYAIKKLKWSHRMADVTRSTVSPMPTIYGNTRKCCIRQPKRVRFGHII